MSFYIIIREKNDNDTPSISEVVRNGYLSNVTDSFLNTIFQEVTFQLIVLISAILFICFGVPLYYSIISVPIVLITEYLIIYISLFTKSVQLLYDKKPLKCWVAEAYEPYFFMKKPENCWYKIIDEMDSDVKLHRKVIGTISVGKHLVKENCCWLFRLVVDKRYRRKGVGLKLINTVQNWCRINQFNNIELVISECQEGCRELFNKSGFDMNYLYHKQLLGKIVTLQMFQLKCEVRSTF